jgi:hypothetical protein
MDGRVRKLFYKKNRFLKGVNNTVTVPGIQSRSPGVLSLTSIGDLDPHVFGFPDLDPV